MASPRLPRLLDLEVEEAQARSAKVDSELCKLIRQMAQENPTWGAPRIHAELRLLGFDFAESTVLRYVDYYRQNPPSRLILMTPFRLIGQKIGPGSEPRTWSHSRSNSQARSVR